MDHQGKNTHLGSTAVVQFDRELLVDGLSIPARCLQLGFLDVILASSIATLNHRNGQKGAEDRLRRKIGQSSKASLHVRQVIARGQRGGKAVASSRHQVAKDGQLGDAAVLGLDKAEAIELGLISIGKKTKRIPESKRSLRYWKIKFASIIT